jgi:simple sugar transport system ATP-binding protein
MAALVEMHGIAKSFGNHRVLSGVDLSVDAGEVLALLGDNAAGKSTLMKVLSGAVVPDAGRVAIDGREVTAPSPRRMRELGVEMVYQDLSLCDTVDVAHNLFLGREVVGRFGLMDERAMHERAAALLQSLDIRVPSTRQRVDTLSGGQRQAIAVARAVTFRPRVLILDEPTSALGVAEVEQVLSLIRRVRDQGVAILFITHRLQDVFAVADRVAVLYEGRKVADWPTAGLTLEGVVNAIVGKPA